MKVVYIIGIEGIFGTSYIYILVHSVEYSVLPLIKDYFKVTEGI